MISNPATFFIDGTNERAFTYEGGTKLFHWSPYESHLSRTMESNVIFLANDIDHARDVLRRLFEFWIDCHERYIKSQRQTDKRRRIAVNDYHGDLGARASDIDTLRRYLTVMDQMVITEAPANQFYKVGWACNDELSV